MKSIRSPFRTVSTRTITPAAALFIITGFTALRGASFYWDADPATEASQNGDGGWNTTNSNWTSTAGGLTNISWLNDGAHTAFLGNVSGNGYTNASTGGVITLDETINLTSLSMSSGQTGAYTINGGVGITLNLSNGAASIANNNSSATLTVNAVVSGNLGLNKINNGRVVLNGANTYTGTTSLSAGTLSLGNASALGDSSNPVRFIGGSLQYTSANTVDYSANIANSTSAISIDTNGQSATWASNLVNTNTGGLTKNGAGTLTLSGVNAYTGTTTVNGGVLAVGDVGSGALTTGGIRLTGGGIIEGSGNFNRTFSNDANPGLNQLSGGTGGFAAKGADLILTFGNANTAVFLSGAGFTNRLGDNFIFGSDTSDSTVIVVNPLNLNGANRNFTVNSGAGGDSAELSGIISAATAVGINKNGTGKLTLSAANTYTGTTSINAGTLALKNNGSINSSTRIAVGSGATFDVAEVTGGYTLAAGQTLTGPGTVVGSASIAGTLSPGSSPGNLSTGSQTWLDGGNYNWQVLNANGLAGADYDTISMTGTLELSNLGTDGFSINLWSLASTGPDANGDTVGFDNTLDYAWTLLTASGGIIGFDQADFTINVDAINGTSGFTNNLGGGEFSLSTIDNSLVLNFNAVPEPSSALLAGFGALFLLRRRRGV